MNKRTEFTLIILTAILAACSAQAAPAPTETPTALPPTATTLPSATASPIPTVTPTPLSPDAQALKDIVFSDCIPVEEGLPEGFDIPWDLLVRKLPDVLIFNPKDDTEVIVPYFSGSGLEGGNILLKNSSISPDGKWVAYSDLYRENIFVEQTGTLLVNRETDRIEWNIEPVFNLSHWIDNETLLVIQTPPEEDAFYPTIFFKPFTGEEYIFSLEELPNYMDYKIGGIGYTTHYLYSGELIPDPTMKKVIYPELWNNELYNTLWDIETESPLTRIKYLPLFINDPLWAQDGSNVLLLSSVLDQSGEGFAEWFLITADGSINQVTQFMEVLHDYSYYINHSSRSRDGQYLVFQLRYNFLQPNEVSKYISLDLQASPLEGFCIPIDEPGLNFGRPMWSPDNRYVLISTVDSYEEGDVFVVDVENEIAYKLAEDVDILGWIEKP